MEFANLWPKGSSQTRLARVASRSDTSGIMSLLRRADYQHMHVDWYLPGDWIGRPGFVVVPRQGDSSGITSKLLGPRPSLRACLAVTADPHPVAWVRVAAMDRQTPPLRTLGDMMELAANNLRQTAVHTIAWLTIQNWPIQWLPKIGFKKVNEIETYIKESSTLPAVPEIPELTIRPVLETDLDQLAYLERKAFNPLWRHSARGLGLARHQAFSFDAAVIDGKIIGFQLSTPSDYGVHLVRLTVDPDTHGLGVGSTLLAHAFQGYHQRGRYRVTLNTQIDNEASQCLYHKFGFFASGQRFPVWLRRL